MSIVLVGSTSGSITLQEPAVAGTTVLTLPAVSGTVLTTTSPKAGNVLQVVSANYGTQVSTASSTFSDTGLTASITPTSASSKILCIIDHNGTYKGTSNTAVQFRLLRNSTAILTWETYAGNTSTAAENGVAGSGCTFLDSPATTSSVTYKTQLASYANLATVYAQVLSSVSTITLMEIAA